MCKDSGYWNKHKQEIAENIGELTMIWNVGEKHRTKAISNGVIVGKIKIVLLL